jgi:hypothetical protein
MSKTTRLIEEYRAAGYDKYLIGLTEAEQQYYGTMQESGEYGCLEQDLE